MSEGLPRGHAAGLRDQESQLFKVPGHRHFRLLLLAVLQRQPAAIVDVASGSSPAGQVGRLSRQSFVLICAVTA